jgi:Helicase associated domain (HA2)/Oligonucleotide/oligosaccharide-binding (OB)-fold
MSRVGMEDLVLQILILDLGEPNTVLSKAITPPSAISLKNSLTLLEELGAVECKTRIEDKTDKSNSVTLVELTALGFHLATLPVESRIGKLIIYGALFMCVEPALTIAAAMSSKSPFLSPFDNRDAAEEAKKNLSLDYSDHLTILTAFDKWRNLRIAKGEGVAKSFAHENFLSVTTLYQMEELRKQFASLLMDIGFLPKDFYLAGNASSRRQITDNRSPANGNAANLALIKAVLSAGTYPNLIVAPNSLVDGTSKVAAGEVGFQSRGKKGTVHLHPCTLAFSAKKLENRYFCYGEIIQTKKLYVRDVTAVSPFALLLFGGALHVYHKEGVVSVDEWLKFRITAKTATLVKHLRGQMEGMLLQKIITPEEDVTSTTSAKAIIGAISTLLYQEGRGRGQMLLRDDGAEIVRPWHGDVQGGRADQKRGGRGRNSPGRGRGRNGPRRNPGR